MSAKELGEEIPWILQILREEKFHVCCLSKSPLYDFAEIQKMKKQKWKSDFEFIMVNPIINKLCIFF